MCLRQFATIYLLMYVSQLAYSNGVDLNANLSSIAYHHCPISKFCKSGMDSLPPGMLSCCEQCSCESDCHVGHRCCPDSDVDHSNFTPMSCKSMDEHFNIDRNVTSQVDFVRNPSYYVIDYCRENFTNTDVIEGCLKPRTTREHVFVTDPRSMLIYKNYQCAICNDVLQYEFWNLKVICSYNDSLFTVNTDEDIILKYCNIYSKPVASSLSREDKWTCNAKMIDSCNITGEWDLYDDTLVDACATYNIPYTLEEYDGGLISEFYKNVYCFLCNKKTGATAANYMCLLPEPPGEGTDLFAIPFEGILDLVAYESIQTHQEPESHCDANEMVDHITGECVDMLCPFGQTPFFGSCTSYMNDAHLSLAVIFEFEFTASRSVNLTGNQPVQEQLYNALFNLIKGFFVTKDCIYCSINVYSNVVLIKAIPSTTCSNENVLQLFEQLEQVSWINTGMTNEKFELRLWITTRYSIIKDPHRIHIFSLDTIKKDFRGNCMLAVQLPPKFYCTRMKFSLFNLINNGRNNGTIANILAKSEPDTFVDGIVETYVICVDDYKSISNKGVRTKSFKITLFFIPLWLLLVKT